MILNNTKINIYNILIFILAIIFLNLNSIFLYIDAKAYEGSDFIKNDSSETDYSNPTGEFVKANNNEDKNNSNSSSDFTPIDISKMKGKKITEEQKKSAITINITRTGEGGNDTSYEGLSEIAIFNRSNDAILNLFNLVKKWSNIFLGIAIVFGLAGMVILFVQLGIYSSNPRARASIKHKLTIISIATAVSTFISVFFNLFIKILTRN